MSEQNNSKPLVILRGEYGIVSGDGKKIASPNPKSGTILVMSDGEQKIVAMAHLFDEKNLDENLNQILQDLANAGANLQNLKCNIIENHE